MRRIFTITAIAGALVATTINPAQATGRGPCSEDRYEVTATMSITTRNERMKDLIRCAFTHVGIPAQIPTAQDVAWRESRYTPSAKNPATWSACRPWSSNPYGSCGLFQHLARYWPGRVRTFGKAWWFPQHWPQVPVLQARANALVTARMVKRGGWGPWA